MASVRIHIENFRNLRKVDLRLEEGISVLIGPNGAGKSSLLHALQIMHDTLVIGPASAIERAGGPGLIKSIQAAERDRVFFEVEIDDARWNMRPTFASGGLVLPVAEQCLVKGKVVIEQKASTDGIEFLGQHYKRNDATNGRSAVRHAFELQSAIEAAGRKFPGLSLGRIVRFHRYYDPDLFKLRTFGSTSGSETALSSRGENLFNVMRNWQAGERVHRLRSDFVREALRDAFPDIFDDLDFQIAGQTVTARFYMPKISNPLPIHVAPNGLLIGMLHLAGLASIDSPPALVAIDEFENSLHPHAIRSLVASVGRFAAERHHTVLLASHSPVLLNCFKDTPSRVFVVEPGHSPIRLDEQNDPDWLAQFSLGDLYSNEDIGAPVPLPAPPKRKTAIGRRASKPRKS